jgi:hypothetical protein
VTKLKAQLVRGVMAAMLIAWALMFGHGRPVMAASAGVAH